MPCARAMPWRSRAIWARARPRWPARSCRALGVTENVPSPTFTLVQRYETPRLSVAHFDLYRVERQAEIEELGLDEALDEGAALIEWPERAGTRLPPIRSACAFRWTRRDAAARSFTGTGALGGRVRRRISMPTERQSEMRCSSSNRPAGVRRRAHAAAGRRLDAPLCSSRDLDRPQGDGDGSAAERRSACRARTRNARRTARARLQRRCASRRRRRCALRRGWPNFLREQGLSAPEIYAADTVKGFAIIEDLGDALYADVWPDRRRRARALSAPPSRCSRRCMRKMRRTLCLRTRRFTPMTKPRCLAEIDLLTDWFLPVALGRAAAADEIAEHRALWQATLARGSEALAGLRASRLSRAEPDLAAGTRRQWRASGVIDFQDAVAGSQGVRSHLARRRCPPRRGARNRARRRQLII